MNKYLLKLYEAYNKTKPYETDIAKDYELNKAQHKVKETKSIIMKHLIKILPKNEAKKLLDELSCGYMSEFCASQKYDVLNGVT